MGSLLGRAAWEFQVLYVVEINNLYVYILFDDDGKVNVPRVCGG
jgi:hypothetical protein